MFQWHVGFDKPQYLLLLLLLPLLWAVSFRSLAGLGKYRRLFALLFRSFVFTLLVFALAEVQARKISDRVTVLYLLDQSESIPQATRELMLKYVIKEVELHRHAGDLQSATEDKAGVIVFGREATIEHPPFADAIRGLGMLESISQIRRDATDISSALKLAQASFPEDSAKRIVIVTDGNENLGDAKIMASVLAENGIGIDVVPIKLSTNAEVAVEKIALPADIRRGQPFEARVVLQNQAVPTPENPTGNVRGKLVVTRKSGDNADVMIDEIIDLPPGKSVKTFQHEIESPAAYTYEARFTPEKASDDLLTQNNAATAFTHVRGKGRVLFIEEAENKGEYIGLIEALGKVNIEVDRRDTSRLFSSIVELQSYDCVVLANVKRGNISTDDKGNITANDGFSNEQIQMLVQNTEQFGCGLVMLGGPDSYGAGGWTGTDLEKAMPVDFQIKNAKVRAVGALAMMMHASEIPEGNTWQKIIGQEALKVLGPMDYCGVVHWDNMTGKEAWLWPKGLAIVGSTQNQKSMLAKMERMTPGDMPDFEPAMVMTLKDMIKCPASVKHCIIISDGDPGPPSSSVVANFKKAQIKISTVAVGAHGPAGHKSLQDIATGTGGKYYVVTNPKALPRIFALEARRVARPLTKEDPNGMKLIVESAQAHHEMLGQIGNTFPPTTGFTMTTVKESPLVEVILRADTAEDPSNNTILAGWTYGAGKTAVVTTDGGQRWAKKWPEWENYGKFFSQVIRWTMRPVNEDGEGGKFSLATDVKDGKVRVVVTALDKNDDFLNNLNMSAAGTGPDLKKFDLSLRQEAPGRYVGEMPVDQSGSYLLGIQTGKKGAPPMLTGIDVPYSAEYRQKDSNEALLATLASSKPKGGEVGTVIQGDLTPNSLKQLTLTDTFRRTLPKAISSQDIWPVAVLLSAGIFFFDVLIRRVTIHFYWVATGLAWLRDRILRRQSEIAPDVAMARLRSNKQAISQQIDERRAATRFEPEVDPHFAPPPARDLDDVLRDASSGASNAPPSAGSARPSSQADTPEQESYTERLLAAKRKAQKENQ